MKIVLLIIQFVFAASFFGQDTIARMLTFELVNYENTDFKKVESIDKIYLVNRLNNDSLKFVNVKVKNNSFAIEYPKKGNYEIIVSDSTTRFYKKNRIVLCNECYSTYKLFYIHFNKPNSNFVYSYVELSALYKKDKKYLPTDFFKNFTSSEKKFFKKLKKPYNILLIISPQGSIVDIEVDSKIQIDSAILTLIKKGAKSLDEFIATIINDEKVFDYYYILSQELFD